MAVYILKSQFVIYFCLCTVSEEDIISEICWKASETRGKALNLCFNALEYLIICLCCLWVHILQVVYLFLKYKNWHYCIISPVQSPERLVKYQGCTMSIFWSSSTKHQWPIISHFSIFKKDVLNRILSTTWGKSGSDVGQRWIFSESLQNMFTFAFWHQMWAADALRRICVYLDSVSCTLSSEDQTSFIWSIVILQATAAAAGSSPVCSQTSEDQPSHPLRSHRHPSIRWSTETVFPQNPTARQRHSQPHFIRSVGPQRAPQGLWRTCETSNLSHSPPCQIKWSICGVMFLCFAENSEHSGCWDDADGCSCSCSGDSFFYLQYN